MRDINFIVERSPEAFVKSMARSTYRKAHRIRHIALAVGSVPMHPDDPRFLVTHNGESLSTAEYVAVVVFDDETDS